MSNSFLLGQGKLALQIPFSPITGQSDAIRLFADAHLIEDEKVRRHMTGSPVHFTRPAGEPYSVKERMDSCWKNIVDQHKQQVERLSNPLSEEQEEMNEPFVPMLRPRFVPELIFTETTLFDHKLALVPRVGISPDEEED